jgi:hypothetical protein
MFNQKKEKSIMCDLTSLFLLIAGSPSSGKTVSASFAGLMSLFLVLWSALA